MISQNGLIEYNQKRKKDYKKQVKTSLKLNTGATMHVKFFIYTNTIGEKFSSPISYPQRPQGRNAIKR